MMILPWLTELDEDLRVIFQTAGVPLLEKQDFDGDGWVWAGREYLEQPTDGGTARVAEVQFRARPDQLQEGPQAELLAAAWGLPGRRGGWSRRCWARYVEPSELHNNQLIEELTGALQQAWQAAREAAERLASFTDHRDEAIGLLNERGVSIHTRPGVRSSRVAVGEMALHS